MMIRTPLVLVLVVLSAASVRGGVEARIVWVEGKPQVELSLDGERPQDVKVIDVPVELFDSQGTRLWAGAVKVPLDGAKPWQGRVPLPDLKEPKKPHRV